MQTGGRFRIAVTKEEEAAEGSALGALMVLNERFKRTIWLFLWTVHLCLTTNAGSFISKDLHR